MTVRLADDQRVRPPCPVCGVGMAGLKHADGRAKAAQFMDPSPLRRGLLLRCRTHGAFYSNDAAETQRVVARLRRAGAGKTAGNPKDANEAKA